MNPADLQRVDSISNFDAIDGLSGKSLAGATSLLGKNVKISVAAPRIDTEAVYTSLKAAIGDEHFAEYKSALGSFLVGKLDQAELTTIINPCLASATSSLQNGQPPAQSAMHLHNTFLMALYANILYREAPPEATASWVTTADLASSGSKSAHSTGANDKIDERNRREVMALSVRDRRRIKSVKDAPTPPTGLAQSKRYHSALDAQPSSILYGLGTTSAPLGKTNTDLEIRRRFAFPLASETQEFPSRENISARIEPICYGEGLVGATPAVGGGTGAAPALAELLETALETYVKELVAGWLGATRQEGDGLVQTEAYRKRLRQEERRADLEEDSGAEKGVRDELGRLPVEVEALGKRAALGVGDLRLATRLEGGMRYAPFFGARWIEEGPMAENEGESANGVEGHAYDAMDVDGEEEVDESWGWAGAGGADRNALMDVLGETMAVG